MGRAREKQAKLRENKANTRENRRKTGAFLVLIFLGKNWSVLIFTPFATMVHYCQEPIHRMKFLIKAIDKWAKITLEEMKSLEHFHK